MRPQILFPLFASIDSLPGVGPKTAKLLERLAGARVVDLLWHLPSGLIDRRAMPKAANAPSGVVATFLIRVEAHQPPGGRRRPTTVITTDDSGPLDLVFFNIKRPQLESLLPIGSDRVVSGRVEWFQGRPQIVHPDRIGPPSALEDIRRVEPVYPSTAGLFPKPLAKAVSGAVAQAPNLPEWLDGEQARREQWRSWRDSLILAHAPQNAADLEPDAPARRRLAYDEMLANQLALQLVRRSMRRRKGRSMVGTGRLTDRIIAALPFPLTRSQENAIAEIRGDMARDDHMLRLLQGDVGSGKTLVALIAMTTAVEAGVQAALLAPTEILARQHHATIAPLAEAAGVAVGLITGRDKGKARQEALSALERGDIDIMIGTHALVQEGIAFHDLGLAVIDEQHRFGVSQRLELARKGRAVDILVMTATPIPRTLQLTAYGDMEASRLTEKPPGRRPVDTRVMPVERMDGLVEGLRRQFARGARAYWVCPAVEESEASELAAATSRFESLAKQLGPIVGLVHGRMKPAERDATMAAFAAGAIQLLVATTVIEVGVDVPEASIIVIEHAERFGLAQLHQLRGRVGRGTEGSVCILLYAGPLGDVARARLEMLRATDDGFRIAEEDLRLRGGGEVLGTRQHGLPAWRVADLAAHHALLAAAQDDARLILERDPDLASERGRALRILLYLFERDSAVRYLRSG